MTFLNMLAKYYFGPLHAFLEKNPHLIKTMPGFLVQPEMLIVYVGRTHIAVEYLGPELVSSVMEDGFALQMKYYDYSKEDCNLFEKIVGLEYDSTLDITLPLPVFSEDLVMPTNRGLDELTKLGWNFAAQNFIMGINTPAMSVPKGRFCRVVNGMFFDADESSGLKSRRIKWLDLFPIRFDGSDSEADSFSFSLEYMQKAVEDDANYSYPIPTDYKYGKLPLINRFIELWGSKDTTEPMITAHLGLPENQFILTMKFGALRAHAQLNCEWQSEQKNSIQPDYFVVQPNGYADIVEFKLPHLGKNVVVGIENRETFSAWLQSYISQTRVYQTYFDDPNNRRWFEEKYGFKVHKPKRWLIVGRRQDFESSVWRDIISDYHDFEIMTFDDLIDGVVVQFYK
ncbi:Shedu anti-phage system protein SduA domain-containing protein [Herbaspirillum sp. NPDC101396]|uniref:Shedu anti-phage system protein SduA domain-containing protein n=1 Tax=Herbaspirillum sp. NPDC101396 TaxID=3364005 RepID=UPI00383A20CC